VSFADAMRRAGWGRDEAGDARRRADLESARVTGPEAEELFELGRRGLLSGPGVRRAVEDDLRRRAERILADAKGQLPADHPVQEEPDPVPGHRVERTRNGTATIVRCECGRWDGAWTGPRSRRRVMDDHAEHVAAELRAAGPIRVKSERADPPKELEP
jgi:hypothetical protein